MLTLDCLRRGWEPEEDAEARRLASLLPTCDARTTGDELRLGVIHEPTVCTRVSSRQVSDQAALHLDRNRVGVMRVVRLRDQRSDAVAGHALPSLASADRDQCALVAGFTDGGHELGAVVVVEEDCLRLDWPARGPVAKLIQKAHMRRLSIVG